MKKLLYLLLPLLSLLSCQNATEKWFSGLSGSQSIRDKFLSLELTRIGGVKTDTTAITYRVRLRPVSADGRESGPAQMLFNMDSCFTLSCGGHRLQADLVEKVNNGIAGSYEYLVSFPVDRDMRHGALQFVYSDRYLSQKQYTLNLTGN